MSYEQGFLDARKALGEAIAEVLQDRIADELWPELDAAWTACQPPPSAIPSIYRQGGARASDPETSKAAAALGPPTRDSKRGIALAIHYRLRGPAGLTASEVAEHAEALTPGGLSDTHWKRVSELGTDYHPPLIEPVRDAEGEIVKRVGSLGALQQAQRITDAGIWAYLQMMRGAGSALRSS